MFKRHGFTSLEILIVITVISIITYVGIIRYQTSINKKRLESSVTKTISFLELAKQYSVSMNQPIAVSMNLILINELKMSILKPDPNPFQGQHFSELTIAETIDMQTKPTIERIVFSPTRSIQIQQNGVVKDTSENVTLSFSNATGKAVLEILLETGAVHRNE